MGRGVMERIEDRRGDFGYHQNPLLQISTVVSIILLATYIIGAKHGLDFTDEGFYLNWIKSPNGFEEKLTYFGDFYHSIYLLASGDIFWLRVFNILTIFLISIQVGIECQCNVGIEKKRDDQGSSEKILVATTIACGCLVIHTISTPNYNSLALLGSLINALFLSKILKTESKQYSHQKGLFHTVALTFGLVCIGLAKPTSFGAAWMLVLITQIFIREKSKTSLIRLGLLASAIIILPLYFTITQNGIGLQPLIKAGLENVKTLDNSYGSTETIYKLMEIPEFAWDNISFLLISCASFVALYFSLREKTRRLKLVYYPISLGCAYIAINKIISSGSSSIKYSALATVGTLLAAISIIKVESRNTKPKPSIYYKNRNILTTFFSIIPIASAIGTNNNLWTQSSYFMIFFPLSAIIFVSGTQIQNSKLKRKLLAVIATLTLIYSAPTVIKNINNPYRQVHPLYSQTHKTIVGETSELYLDKNRSKIIEKFRTILIKEKSEGIEILDLTGHSPGFIHAIGGKPLARAWLTGGYPGSNLAARTILEKIQPDRLKRCWILTETNGNRTINISILEERGIDEEYLKNNMILVAKATTNKNYKKEDQKSIYALYKPNTLP